MKKYVLTTITIILVVILVSLLMSGRPTRELREASLYATTIEDIPVLRDTSGALWEIERCKEVSKDDKVLLEIVDNEVSRVWLEVVAETGN